jgi:hypothetical protein
MKPDYRSSLGWTVCLFLFFITGCATQATEDGQAKDLAIIESWSGDFPVADLVVLPEGQSESHAGYIDDQKAFAAVWRAFKPGEKIPTVDFKRNLVVFSRNVDFYNRTQILKVTLNGGGAEILAMETMSAMPIEDKVAMALAVVPRAGVDFILSGDGRVSVTDNR